ncbi:hypothetical protein CPCC7001_431 [Cyanobium sp. PCC 7001]|uniref:hypothetical protein n=1 Tax=Cyanobium sp. PCC 7001 TaxID=180281 RepID=UPI0001805463|nr:hypothetical protein [Cyanobium sp. PCC 7001]EDY37552.1 hypothetical protein CPCC7001_431 [Cyanobium sp. PCC 7001]
MENYRLPHGVNRAAWARFIRRHTRIGLIPIDECFSYGGSDALKWQKLLKAARRWQDDLLQTEDRHGFPRA